MGEGGGRAAAAWEGVARVAAVWAGKDLEAVWALEVAGWVAGAQERC